MIVAGNIAVAAPTGTATEIFASTFKSLRTTVEGNLLAPAVINLGSTDKLNISFDELAEDYRYLRYKLVHCNADWTPSQLVESEYINGFNIADIYSYAYSESTLAHYVHYDLSLPNEDITFTLSGNYLLQVFDQDEPDDILLQTRFMVSENCVDITSELTSRTDVDYNRRHHQLAIEAGLEHANVADPFNELTLVLEQNGRPDTRRTIVKPLRTSINKVVYEHQPGLIFPAGNEYRRFEMVNVRFPLRGIDHYEYADPYYHAILTVDTPRADSRYDYDEDQSGRFFPGELNADDSDIQADYIVTHFTLEMPQLQGRDVYLDGDMVQRKLDADSRMVYDQNRGAYVKTLLLKQGLYNYQYITSPAEDNSDIEGDKYETVNEYLILLYHRPQGARYDRLIGSSVIYSHK
jgi:hypothetical protein